MFALTYRNHMHIGKSRQQLISPGSSDRSVTFSPIEKIHEPFRVQKLRYRLEQEINWFLRTRSFVREVIQMKKIAACLILFLGILNFGCASSLHPFYSEADVIFDKC